MESLGRLIEASNQSRLTSKSHSSRAFVTSLKLHKCSAEADLLGIHGLVDVQVGERAGRADVGAGGSATETRTRKAAVTFLHRAVTAEARHAEGASYSAGMTADTKLAAHNDRATLEVTTQSARRTGIQALGAFAMHARR